MVAVCLIASIFTACSHQDSTTAKTSGQANSEKSSELGNANTQKKKIILITIDSMDQHWVNMDKGCKKAAKELNNIDYKWIAPDAKDDNKQIECVNNAVASGADAILIAANGPDAITSALKDADSEGVKLVQVDSFANYSCVQKIGTNNVKAGEIAGKHVLEALKAKGIKKGNIGIVSVNASCTSTVDRDNGFRSAFKGTEFKILPTQFGEGEAAKSKDLAANFISQGVVALFGANEGSAVGVGNANKENGNSVIAAGMDKSNTVINLVKSGSLLLTMEQDPEKMGYLGIQAAVKSLKGEKVTPAYIDTGVTVLDKVAANKLS
jgi:ribose transport system substrate-binding protein